MKKVVVLLSWVVMVFCSCHSDKEYTPPMDLGDFFETYQRAMKNEAMFDSIAEADCDELYSDSLASPLGNPQGLSCLSQWWIDLKPESDGNMLLKNAAQMYNIIAFKNAIGADFEIWNAADNIGNEPLVQTDSIRNAIIEMDVHILDGETNRQFATGFRDAISSFVGDTAKINSIHNPFVVFNNYDSTMTVKIIDVVINKDYDGAHKCSDRVDALIDNYSVFRADVGRIYQKERFMRILQEMMKARTFDDQCAILLACSKKNDTFDPMWTPHLMKTMLQSGRYSILLERMWRLWRAFSQEQYGGMSKSSYIPNYSYDKLRKVVYKTIVGYSEQNPEDKDAIFTAAILANDSWLRRDGEYIYGNQAAMEIYELGPDFYEDQ